jgi:hypothetical protein
MRWFILLLGVGLSGCTDLRPEPISTSGGMKEGPGILTGEKGFFQIPLGPFDHDSPGTLNQIS